MISPVTYSPTFHFSGQCLLMCAAVAVASFQYGFDTAVSLDWLCEFHSCSDLQKVVNGFQATAGFVRVFGVPNQSGNFVIQVS